MSTRKTAFWLFIIALSVRAVIATFQTLYGINNGINFDQYLYGIFNPGLELYHDFYLDYIVQLSQLSRGLFPYTQITTYAYPPLFLYTLYPFYRLGGSFAASLPIWISDAATAPLVYLVARQFTSSKLSFIAGLSYAISPFFLLYEGYLWLSSQPMTFFMILSLYLLIMKRPISASAAFAIAILFKQELVFIFPIYLIYMYVHFGKAMIVRSLGVICAIILAVSLPFLLIAPGLYLYIMSYGIIPVSIFGPSHFSYVVALGQTITANGSSTLSCSTLSETWRSLLCHFGNLTYTDSKFIPSWTAIFTSGFINSVSTLIFVPLMIITLFNLIRLRKDPSFLILLGCVIFTALLATFSFEVHSVYRYYFVPVYILPLLISRTKLSLSLAITIPILSLALPSGSVQLLPPLFLVLMVLLLDHREGLGLQEKALPHPSSAVL